MPSPPPADTAPAHDLIRLADASVTLFGHPLSEARVALRVRSGGWRLRRALPALSITLIATPLAALVPPHAPWAVGALAVGGIVTWRRWREAFTVVGFEAPCPRCGADLEIDGGSRLRFPHPVECPGCRHEPILVLDRERLEARASAASGSPSPYP